MSVTEPVLDWASDYDVLDPAYVADPAPIWDELRQSCPIAHTNRWGSSWLPTRYDDVASIAHDIERFSSRGVGVIPPIGHGDEPVLPAGLPPISTDPPTHTWSRRLLLPWFSHRRVEQFEPLTRDLCRSLAEGHRGTRSRRCGRRLRAADTRPGHRPRARGTARAGGHVHRMGQGRARVRP